MAVGRAVVVVDRPEDVELLGELQALAEDEEVSRRRGSVHNLLMLSVSIFDVLNTDWEGPASADFSILPLAVSVPASCHRPVW